MAPIVWYAHSVELRVVWRLPCGFLFVGVTQFALDYANCATPDFNIRLSVDNVNTLITEIGGAIKPRRLNRQCRQ